jgi:GNAT superfamily N-acetyltransferase
MDAESTAPITIRAVAASDQPAWERLYRQYAAFYRVPMGDALLDATWAWLMQRQRLEGIVAVQGGALVGLAHFRSFPEPLLGKEAGFLDDLFVAPTHRGRGAGRMLIAAVSTIAHARSWPVLRWITAADNAAARHLYDRVAQATAWVTYDLHPQRR